MENQNTPDVQPIAGQSEAAQSKSNRPTAKQRKSDLEDYQNILHADQARQGQQASGCNQQRHV